MKKWTIILASISVVVIAAVVVTACNKNDQLYTRARKEWKTTAISQITRKFSGSIWLTNETRTLKSKVEADSDAGEWISDYLLIMKNGDWIVYSSKCSKEDRRIHDIFIGRGSDGKWYYSTYHFCIGMVSLRIGIDKQSESLTKFIETYHLRQFDGSSDECLKRTWPLPRK